MREKADVDWAYQAVMMSEKVVELFATGNKNKVQDSKKQKQRTIETT